MPVIPEDNAVIRLYELLIKALHETCSQSEEPLTEFAPHSSTDHDLAALERRVLRRRHRYAQVSQLGTQPSRYVVATFRDLPTQLRKLPQRYFLHLLIVGIVPIALGLTHIYREPLPAVPTPALLLDDELTIPVAPISLDAPFPDAAFAEIDALPSVAYRPELLAVQPVPARIAAASANLRQGPGTVYDLAGEMTLGAELTLLAVSGDWYKARRDDGGIVWVMGELLDMNQTAASLLAEATDIPAPPPPKIATVVEPNLNLRDGPNTKYVGMTKLDVNMQLDLLGRYNDWFQVQTPQGQQGWVKGEFLNMVPGVVDRIEVLTSVPDAHPALVGAIRESGVNLRQGPGTAYGKATKLGAGTQFDVLARYADWFKIRTTDGTTGWVSKELIAVSDYIARRVVVTRDIPALPKPKAAVVAKAKAASPRGPVPAPAASSGSLVDFAMQYVGAAYIWGAAGPGSFDCSGFTQYVYKQHGLSLPHSSGGQYNSRYGAIISDPADLRAGDIVFFVNTYKRGISHVGIYAGGGNVVQAMSPERGLGVANIRGGYWQQHYYSAIRPNL